MMDQILEFTNNNLLLVALSIGVFLAALFNELKIKEGDICGLSTIDAIKFINKNSAVIDLRSSDAFEQKHILSSTSSAKQDLSKEFFAKQKDPVLLVCETGGQSKKTSLRYRKDGVDNVFYIKGGIMEWESNSLPLSS